mmetsp:Transcript_16649/g.41609  ORF Transcript_16649/g.41609 Transcript_16649/m.41609 type:complete len:254 (-) Transcript_16649:959-1720(-)
MAHVHSRNVVHGDLTSVNVLLASAGGDGDGSGRGFVAKVSDFGLSLEVPEAQEYVVRGSYGAITHMAPEVLESRQIGYKGDVYSLGVLMWQMLTGSRPWSGLSHLQVTVAVGLEKQRLQWPTADGGFTPLPTGASGGAQSVFAALGARCMDPDPDVRPTAAEALDALRDLARVDLPGCLTGPLDGHGHGSHHHVPTGPQPIGLVHTADTSRPKKAAGGKSGRPAGLAAAMAAAQKGVTARPLRSLKVSSPAHS